MRTWNALEVARSNFPQVPDAVLHDMVWSDTGFPSFWATREGETVEQCFLRQLRSAVDKWEKAKVMR